jgi:hypothetical protein
LQQPSRRGARLRQSRSCHLGLGVGLAEYFDVGRLDGVDGSLRTSAELGELTVAGSRNLRLGDAVPRRDEIDGLLEAFFGQPVLDREVLSLCAHRIGGVKTDLVAGRQPEGR